MTPARTLGTAIVIIPALVVLAGLTGRYLARLTRRRLADRLRTHAGGLRGQTIAFIQGIQYAADLLDSSRTRKNPR